MSNIKSPISFEILETGDGSPTLSLNGGEKMHSMEGALSESLYIYGECLLLALNQASPIHLLSMGLGLGYNEWMSLAILAKADQQNFSIHSFESQSFLTEALKAWIHEKESPLSLCFDQIIQLMSQQIEVSKEKLKLLGQEAIADGRWQLHGPLPNINSLKRKFNVIFYDAFSSETDDYLWTEDHLENFMIQYCENNCYFSTYAATGKLKRTLQKNGFLLKKKAGFGKKRESTLALRQCHSEG